MLTNRLGFENQKDEAYIRELVAAVRRNPGSYDEFWLASDFGFPSLEKHRISAAKLAASAKILREAGIRVSLMLSNTVGHGDYMGVRDCSGLVYEGSEIEHFTDMNGTVANLCFCWYGEHFRRYLAEEIAIYCSALKPYRVWVDDDFRYDNHDPSSFGCMCDGCLAKFNRQYGYAFDRAGLRDASARDLTVRENFCAFVRDGLADTARFIAENIKKASPESSVGYQHGGGCVPCDSDFKDLFRAFAEGTGKTVGTRPGAGTYNDHNPADMLFKADCIRYQNSITEGYVDDIRPEIENFPHVCFGKSPAGTAYETSVYFAAGATAMSYAVMMYEFEPVSWHERLMAQMTKHRKYWETLSALNRDTYECGLTHYIPADYWKRPLAGYEHPMAWCDAVWYDGNDIERVGIPVSFRRSSAKPVYMLTAWGASAMSAGDVEYLTACPVLCDGAALCILRERGFGDYFSADAFYCHTLKIFERYTDHPVNPKGVCQRWENGMLSREGSYLADKTGETEILGYYDSDGIYAEKTDPDGKYPYGVSTAIVHTKNGGKWLVCGQVPWTSVVSWSKRQMLLNGLDAISGKRLPAFTEGYEETVVYPRENEKMQTTSVSVVNTTVGPAEGIRLRVRRPAGETAVCCLPDGSRQILPTEPVADDEISVVLPEIAPWNLCTVAFQRKDL